MKTKFFNTRTIVTLAMLTAIGYGLSWLEFPIFPPAPFLKLDFSTFVTLFGGYMFGFPGAVIIEGLKQLLIWGTKSSTAGVGELANFIIVTSFVAFPTVLYKFKKGRAWVAVGLGVGCVIQIAVSLLCNRYINFPLFVGDGAAAMFASLWGYVLAFNAIKSVSVSVLVFLLYKRLSFVLKKFVLTNRKASEKIDGQVENTAPKQDATAQIDEITEPTADNGEAEEPSEQKKIDNVIQ